jgi:hypothetical protein
MTSRITLERYNQMVWAAIGSAALLLVGISAIVALVAWILSGPSGVPVEVVEDDSGRAPTPTDIRVEICPPVHVEGSPYQLIGVAVDRIVIKNRTLLAKRARGIASSYSDEANLGGCGYQGEGSFAATGNVLIRDTRTGTIRPMLAQNALVHRMEYPVRSVRDAERTFPPQGVLYWEIATADTSDDGMLDEQDDIGAWLSDIDGTKLTRVTPPNSRVESKTYDDVRHRLYLKIVQDTDGNRKLDDQDSSALIEVDVSHRRIVGTILDARHWARQVQGFKPLNDPR